MYYINENILLLYVIPQQMDFCLIFLRTLYIHKIVFRLNNNIELAYIQSIGFAFGDMNVKCNFTPFDLMLEIIFNVTNFQCEFMLLFNH